MLQKLKSPPVAFAIIAIFDKLVPLILLPIFVQSVGVADYGKLYFLHALNLFMAPVINVGFVLHFTSNYYKKSDEINSKVLGNYFIVECAVGLLLLILSGSVLVLHDWKLSALDTITYVLVFSLLPVLSNMSRSSKEVFRIKMRITHVLLISLVTFISDVSISLFFLKVIDLGWHSRIIGMVCNRFIITSICLIALRKDYKLSFDREVIKNWFAFGLPIIRHRIVGVFMNLGDRYLISGILGNYALGLYTIAIQITSPLSILNNAIKTGWNPWFYKNIVNPDRDWKFFQRLIFIIMGGFVIGAIIYSIVLPFVVGFFLDDVNLGDVLYISVWIAFAYGFQLIYFLTLPYLIHHSKSQLLANITTASGIVSIVGNLILLKEFGIVVSGLFFCISWVLQAFMVSYFGFRHRREGIKQS